MTSMYELNEQESMLLDFLVDDPDNQEAQEALNELQSQIANKADRCGYVIKSLDASEKALDDEIKRLQARKKAFANAKDRVREAVRLGLQNMPDKKIKTALFTFSENKGREKLVIDESSLDRDYFTEQVKLVADKDKIKAAIEQGEHVKGVMIERKPFLQMR